MKRNIAIIGSVLIAMIMFVSACSKDDSPAETDIFVGTYRGSISYTQGEELVSDTDGRVTVVKVGNSYTFDFGSGIPNITGVEFQESDDNTHVSIGEGLEGITITAQTLKILVVNDQGAWTANCSR